MTFWINVLIAVLGAALLMAQFAASVLPPELRTRLRFLSKKRWSMSAIVLVGMLMLLGVAGAWLGSRSEANHSTMLAAAERQRTELSEALAAAETQRAGFDIDLKAIKSAVDALAPKQTVPDTGDPLKIKAVELFNDGLDAYHAGEIGQAIGRWLSAVDLDPDYSYAHNNLGVALKAKGDLDAAIEHYHAAIRINPTSAKYHDNLAIALAQKRATTEAVAELAKAIELDERYRAWARSDTDYDPIRDDPAFRKLVYGE